MKIMRNEMGIITDVKYGMLFGFIGFALTLISWYFATGALDPRFPAVIGAGLFGGGFLGSLMRRLHREGEERKANFIFLAVILIATILLIADCISDILIGNWKSTLTNWKILRFVSIFASVYLICYIILRIKKSKDVKT